MVGNKIMFLHIWRGLSSNHVQLTLPCHFSNLFRGGGQNRLRPQNADMEKFDFWLQADFPDWKMSANSHIFNQIFKSYLNCICFQCIEFKQKLIDCVLILETFGHWFVKWGGGGQRTGEIKKEGESQNQKENVEGVEQWWGYGAENNISEETRWWGGGCRKWSRVKGRGDSPRRGSGGATRAR